MPEETNRVVTDHISDYLFAVSEKQEKILFNEGISSTKIHVVGNTVIDSIKQNKEIAKLKSNILEKQNLKSKEFFLVTVHRASNVDNITPLKEIINLLDEIQKKYKYKIFWPIHPRTKKYLDKYNIKINKNIILGKPCGYLDFLELQSNAKLIITD